jgi:hypothetical protein
MAKKEATSPASLSTMLGTGDTIEIQGKTYTVKPIKLKDVDSFMKDNLSIGTQFYSVALDNYKEKINRWLKGYCFDENDKPMSLETATKADWDVVDLRHFVTKLCDLSG